MGVMHSFEIDSRTKRQRKSRVWRLPLYSLFSRYCISYFLAVLSAGTGVLVSTVDYQLRYSPLRTHSNLLELPQSDSLRYVSLSLTLVSISLLVAKEIAYLHWKQSQESYVSPLNLYWQVPLLVLFPYPGLSGSISLEQRYRNSKNDWETTICKYSTSEFLLFFCYFRVFLLYDFVLSTSECNDSLGSSMRRGGKTSGDRMLALKVYFANWPWVTLALMLAPVFVLCTMTITVFERPLGDISMWDFYPLGNAAWVVTESILSMNYGDLVPISHFGRLAALIAGQSGVILISIIVLIARNRFLRLSTSQLSALSSIQTQRKAKSAIAQCLLYYKAKQQNQNDENTASKALTQLRNSLSEFKLVRKKTQKELKPEFGSDEKRIEEVKEMIEAIIRQIA